MENGIYGASRDGTAYLAMLPRAEGYSSGINTDARASTKPSYHGPTDSAGFAGRATEY